MYIEFNYFKKRLLSPPSPDGLMEIQIVRNSYSWWDSGCGLLSQMHQSMFSGTDAVVPWQVQLFHIPEDS
jgi:hypothetical protein